MSRYSRNNEVAAVVNWGLRFAFSFTNLGSSVVPKLRSCSLSCSLCVQYATSIVLTCKAEKLSQTQVPIPL